MGQVTNGVDKIEVGAVGAGGTMGTSLAVLGYTNIDSANFTEEDPTITDFKVEELDEPIYSSEQPGKKQLTFQIADPDLNTYQEVFGGTITGSGASAVWNAPDQKVRKEVSVLITPKVGYTVSIPRGVMRGKFNGALSKNALQMIDITIDVLQPEDVNTSPIIIGPAVVPTT